MRRARKNTSDKRHHQLLTPAALNMGLGILGASMGHVSIDDPFKEVPMKTSRRLCCLHCTRRPCIPTVLPGHQAPSERAGMVHVELLVLRAPPDEHQQTLNTLRTRAPGEITRANPAVHQAPRTTLTFTTDKHEQTPESGQVQRHRSVLRSSPHAACTRLPEPPRADSGWSVTHTAITPCDRDPPPLSPPPTHPGNNKVEPLTD